MDYRSALDYVLSFADYERWPGAGYAERWDLRRMEDLLRCLGGPHLDRRTVHIAGSKGKGSTAAMLAFALTAGGFRTGLYTSPHLHTIRERIQVDGRLITEQEFTDLVAEIRPHVETTNGGAYGELSTFEILTAMAFTHFRHQSADFQVLETGLGGRLDATNVIMPEVCVLTSISLDHTAVLGDNLARIAGEKAGIIKPGAVVISSPQADEAMEVIEAACRNNGVELVRVGRDVSWEDRGADRGVQSLEVRGRKGRYALTIPLLGLHQMENAATAVAALESVGLESDAVIRGLAVTRWPGRLQILRDEPWLIADGAHNGDSAGKLVESLRRYFDYERSILVIGTSADKNSGDMVARFAPFFNEVITTAARHPRANDPAELVAEFSRHGVTAKAVTDVSRALAEAMSRAGKRDLVCATGSLFLVAEVIEAASGIEGERYPPVVAKG